MKMRHELIKLVTFIISVWNRANKSMKFVDFNKVKDFVPNMFETIPQAGNKLFMKLIKGPKL